MGDKCAVIGIIGGTGLYALEGLGSVKEQEIETPFGQPSDAVLVGWLGEARVAFLARHGSRHELLPSEINYRANIWALKAVGVARIVAVSAVGSLVEEIAPGDLALVEQYFDWTRGSRAASFFGNGLVGHISAAEPICRDLSDRVADAARLAGANVHRGKAYACVEGPRLGTRHESLFLRGAGCDLVGMTNIPEVFLAREAQLCYCSLCIVTDYDCWLDDSTKHVTAREVLANYGKQVERVHSIIRELLGGMATGVRACTCGNQLSEAILSKPEQLTDEARKLLEFLKS